LCRPPQRRYNGDHRPITRPHKDLFSPIHSHNQGSQTRRKPASSRGNRCYRAGPGAKTAG
jgi:hypothetical protein